MSDGLHINVEKTAQYEFLAKENLTMEQALALSKYKRKKLSNAYCKWLEDRGGAFRFPQSLERGGGWVTLSSWREVMPDASADLQCVIMRAVANNQGAKATSKDMKDVFMFATRLEAGFPNKSNLYWDIAHNPKTPKKIKKQAMAKYDSALASW